jgi:hypothetical protein
MVMMMPQSGGSGRSYRPNPYKRKYYREHKKLRSMVRTQKRARFALSRAYPRGSGESLGLYGASYATATPQQRTFRRAMRFKGQGGYWDDVVKPFYRNQIEPWAKSYVPKGALGITGGVLGGMAGPTGALVGAGLGSAAANYLGWGDYGPVSTNAIMDSGHGSNQQISVNKDDLSGDVIFSHTEFVQNVTVTTTGATSTSPFQLVSFPINAALASTFPFLSQIAANFTLYEFEGLMFQYKPTSGEFGASGSNSLGKVIFATNYDPDAIAFTSSQQMENYDYANSTKPSCGMVHGVETKPSQRSVIQLYSRTGVSPKDKVFTDLGLFQVATEGINASAAGTQVIGELWVTYKCRLSRKNLQVAIGTNIDWTAQNMIYQSANLWNAGGSLPNNGQGSSLTPYQSTWTATNPGAQGGFVALNANSIQFFFPQTIVQGTYMVSAETLVTASATQFWLITSPQNCTVRSPYNTTLATVNGTATNGTLVLNQLVNVNAPGSTQASFIIAVNNAWAANNPINVQITLVNPGMNQTVNNLN